MEDIREIITKILDQGFLMSLATIDQGGLWVADLIYVHDNEMNLYWLSQTNARHSKAIIKNPEVAATITISNNPGEENIGLQIEGATEKLEGDIFEIARKHRLKRGKPVPTKEGEILDPGESWYRLKSKKIELTYEPLFGFEKKILFLS